MVMLMGKYDEPVEDLQVSNRLEDAIHKTCLDTEALLGPCRSIDQAQRVLAVSRLVQESLAVNRVYQGQRGFSLFLMGIGVKCNTISLHRAHG